MSLRKAELDRFLVHHGLQFVDEKSIMRLQDGLTFKAKPGLSVIQFALLFKKVQYLDGSYNNVTRSFTVKDHLQQDDTVKTVVDTVDTRLDTVDTAHKPESQHSASGDTQDDTIETIVDTAADTISLFRKIESQLAISGATLDAVAKKLGVGRATVAKVKKILHAAPEQVKEDCRLGKLTINAAYGALAKDAYAAD